MTPRQKEFKALWDQGYGDTDAAREMGVSRSRTRNIRNELGLPANRTAARSNRMDREYLIREFDESIRRHVVANDSSGVTRELVRIGAEVGRHPDYLRRVYQGELGLLPKMQKRYTEEQYAEAGRLLKEHGLPYSEVSKLTKVPSERIQRKFPGLGIQDPVERGLYAHAKAVAREMGIEL